MHGPVCAPGCSGKKLVTQAAPTSSQNVRCKVQSSLSILRGNLGAESFFFFQSCGAVPGIGTVVKG